MKIGIVTSQRYVGLASRINCKLAKRHETRIIGGDNTREADDFVYNLDLLLTFGENYPWMERCRLYIGRDTLVINNVFDASDMRHFNDVGSSLDDYGYDVFVTNSRRFADQDGSGTRIVFHERPVADCYFGPRAPVPTYPRNLCFVGFIDGSGVDASLLKIARGFNLSLYSVSLPEWAKPHTAVFDIVKLEAERHRIYSACDAIVAPTYHEVVQLRQTPPDLFRAIMLCKPYIELRSDYVAKTFDGDPASRRVFLPKTVTDGVGVLRGVTSGLLLDSRWNPDETRGWVLANFRIMESQYIDFILGLYTRRT